MMNPIYWVVAIAIALFVVWDARDKENQCAHGIVAQCYDDDYSDNYRE